MEMIGGRHRSPADVHRRMDIGGRPVEDLPHLVPVGDLFILQQLDRCACYDEAVELAILDLFPGLVEGKQMFLGGVLGLVPADAHQRKLRLQRRCADEARHLYLGLDLVRHEVEKPDLERADILTDRHRFSHHPHTLVAKGLKCGQRIGNLDGHCFHSTKYKKTGRDHESLPVRTRPFSDLFNVAASRPAKSPQKEFHKPAVAAGQWASFAGAGDRALMSVAAYRCSRSASVTY